MDELLSNYNKSIVNVSELKNKVRKSLQSYEKKESESKKRGKAPKEPDEDGWITVRHKKGRDPTKTIAMKERNKKKIKKNKKVLNFYAFEIRESKLKRHQELLEKFEEDKKRLAKMRSQRKFKI